MTETDLLSRCRSGDQEAWRALVARHTRQVFSVAYGIVGRVEEAEDLTQEVFVKIFQSLDRFQESEGAFGGWVHAVARNHTIDHYRKHREEKRRALGSDPLDSLQASLESADRTVEKNEQRVLLLRGLRSLPTDLREPLVLCDLRGLPYEEIARTLELPLGTVKSRINRARLELAKRMRR